MTLTSTAKTLFLTLILSLTTLTPTLAREMVSIKGSIVNMRSGPSTKSDVQWELTKGYPLQVLKRRGRWLQVRDFEGDRGWVARSMTGKTPYHIVKSRIANLRKGPGTRHRITGKVERYDVLRTREKKAGWVRVERQDGLKGWISNKLLWGW